MNKWIVNVPGEIDFEGIVQYKDAFNEIEVDVVFSDENGAEWKIPAFFKGGQRWGVRFAAPHSGIYHYRCMCTDPFEEQLNTIKGVISAEPYNGENPLYKHGAVIVHPGKRYFYHSDGTPFFYLADTWWMILSKRINDDGVRKLAEDRFLKGFTSVQIVNGLWCDCGNFDERCNNEAGYCWKGNYETINPAYYDLADRKIEIMVQAGLMPVILSAWGFYMEFMGLANMKKHVRNMVARWGSYPVMWCIAGETSMRHYSLSKQSTTVERKSSFLKEQWTEIAAYLKEIDTFHRTITAHPMGGSTSVDELLDAEQIEDFYTYQGGHADDRNLTALMTKGFNGMLYNYSPVKPFINMESNYEGMCGDWNNAQMQRYLFWNTILDGAAGFAYGAQGIWNSSSKEEPFGKSFYGINWGSRTWEQAMNAEGSHTLGISTKIMRELPFDELIPAGEIIQNPIYKQSEAFYNICGAYIPHKLFVIFKSEPNYMASVCENPDDYCPRIILPKNEIYDMTFISLADGHEVPMGNVKADLNGIYVFNREPEEMMQCWIILLKRKGEEADENN